MVWMHAGVMFSIYEDESLSEMCGFCLCYRKYVPFMQWNIPQRASFPFVLQKLPLSAEEFIRRMPIISADGGVMVGSKNTTVFLIDAKSGTVIYAFKSADHSATGDQIAPGKPILRVKDGEEQVESSAVDLEEVEQPLYVIRTDYTVKYVSRKTGKDLWSLRFSEIEASFYFFFFFLSFTRNVYLMCPSWFTMECFDTMFIRKYLNKDHHLLVATSCKEYS